MLRSPPFARSSLFTSGHLGTSLTWRSLATKLQTQSVLGHGEKQEGDISAAFPSLSGVLHESLPLRFSQLKKDILSTPEARDRFVASWADLLGALKEGVAELKSNGNEAIPEVSYGEIERGSNGWKEEVLKSGVVVMRDVVDDAEALGWKQQILEYVKENPQVKGEDISLSPLLNYVTANTNA
ncbi:unnamed protein product [Rhizoctonia solani]|uniref:Uncharacterized protein n=1 Tax=Rhizoctonia solani TaxID=456999 RepID=A0A8H3GSW9_9AGAM|nr:unnamed protein product [Rhizoctonia solani]